MYVACQGEVMDGPEPDRPRRAWNETAFPPAARDSVVSRWPNLFNGPYDFLEPLVLKPKDAAAVIDATRKLWSVYALIAALVPLLPDSALLQLGVPESMLGFVRLPSCEIPPTFLGRFDLVRTRRGY